MEHRFASIATVFFSGESPQIFIRVNSYVFRSAVEQVLNSAEYRAARKAAENAADRVKALSALRRESLDSNPTVKKWALESKIAKEKADRIRSELLKADPQCQAAQHGSQQDSEKQKVFALTPV